MTDPVSVPSNDQILVIAHEAIPNTKTNPINHTKLEPTNRDKRSIAHLYFFYYQWEMSYLLYKASHCMLVHNTVHSDYLL